MERTSWLARFGDVAWNKAYCLIGRLGSPQIPTKGARTLEYSQALLEFAS